MSLLTPELRSTLSASSDELSLEIRSRCDVWHLVLMEGFSRGIAHSIFSGIADSNLHYNPRPILKEIAEVYSSALLQSLRTKRAEGPLSNRALPFATLARVEAFHDRMRPLFDRIVCPDDQALLASYRNQVNTDSSSSAFVIAQLLASLDVCELEAAKKQVAQNLATLGINGICGIAVGGNALAALIAKLGEGTTAAPTGNFELIVPERDGRHLIRSVVLTDHIPKGRILVVDEALSKDSKTRATIGRLFAERFRLSRPLFAAGWAERGGADISIRELVADQL